MAASADTHSWNGVARQHALNHPPQWPHCCGSTATRCSRCCGGCTACGIAYRLLYATLAGVMGGRVLAAIAVYAAMDWRQHFTGPAEQLQLAQAVVAALAAAAALPAAAGFVWLAFIAAIVHVATAVMLMDLRRLGDCRTCCNEAARCDCGKHKDPLPSGTLARLADALGQSFRQNGSGTRRPRVSTAYLRSGAGSSSAGAT